jgi:hypothetical protein
MKLTLTLMIETEKRPESKAAQDATWYQRYIPQVTAEQARMLFERKFGYAPAEVLCGAGAVLAGPIRENGRG